MSRLAPRCAVSNSLRVCLFGALTLQHGATTFTAFPTAKSRELLAYLAIHLGELVPRSHLIELLWPGIPASQARGRLSVALYGLRRRLAEAGLPSRSLIVATRSHLQMGGDALETDWQKFRALVLTLESGDEPSALSAAHSLLELSRRPLLWDSEAGWIGPFRAEVESGRCRARLTLERGTTHGERR